MSEPVSTTVSEIVSIAVPEIVPSVQTDDDANECKECNECGTSFGVMYMGSGRYICQGCK